MKRKPNKTPTIFNLSTDVKCQFKAWCAARGKTMIKVIEEMMLEKLKK